MNYSFITMQGIKSIADFHLMNIVWSSLSRATTRYKLNTCRTTWRSEKNIDKSKIHKTE
jgi:hypothetical protein